MHDSGYSLIPIPVPIPGKLYVFSHDALGSKSTPLYRLQDFSLRIPDSYHVKTLKIHTPLVHFALFLKDGPVIKLSAKM